MTRKQICVNLEKALLEKIDTQRGDIPRSRAVERALNAQYCNQSNNDGGRS